MKPTVKQIKEYLGESLVAEIEHVQDYMDSLGGHVDTKEVRGYFKPTGTLQERLERAYWYKKSQEVK